MHVLCCKCRPDLNLVEYCNGRSKRYLADERGDDEFWKEVLKGHAKCTRAMVWNFYDLAVRAPYREYAGTFDNSRQWRGY